MQWVVVIGSVPLIIYGMIKLVSPRTTTRWQVRATAKHGPSDPRALVGTTFQQWMGIDPNGPPSRAVLRRTRLVGVFEIAIGIVYLVGGLAIFR